MWAYPRTGFGVEQNYRFLRCRGSPWECWGTVPGQFWEGFGGFFGQLFSGGGGGGGGSIFPFKGLLELPIICPTAAYITLAPGRVMRDPPVGLHLPFKGHQCSRDDLRLDSHQLMMARVVSTQPSHHATKNAARSTKELFPNKGRHKQTDP